MAVMEQRITDRYAIYCGDCMEVMPTLPGRSSTCRSTRRRSLASTSIRATRRTCRTARNYDEFMEHYGYVVAELARLTMPGRMTAVHCMDVPRSNTGKGDSLMDFPGDIIRLHEPHGWHYVARYHVWKEPLTVRNRTMTKALAHKTIVDDSSRCTVASADYLLVFRRHGENPVPIEHPVGCWSTPASGRCRRNCCATAAGRASRPRTATRTGFGDSTPPRSGMTCGSIACCRSRRRATRRTRSTSTRCNST
jgi:hypothetical protein